jgi:hypothetical protein
MVLFGGTPLPVTLLRPTFKQQLELQSFQRYGKSHREGGTKDTKNGKIKKVEIRP